jgi:uncharacterized membrane protein YfcA
MDLDWNSTDLLLAFVTMAIASAVQGSVGFGLNLLAAPILALIDPDFVPGPAMAAGLVQTIIMAGRERRNIEYGDIGWAAVGRVAGTSGGVLVLSIANSSQANIVFGSLVLVGVALSLVGLRLRPSPRVLVGAGCLSGVMNTISSIGGPPIALVYQHERGAKLRGTLAGHFVAGASISLAGLIVSGHYVASDVVATAVLLPGVLLGFPLARPLTRVIDSRSARPAILALAALSAAAVIAREFF